MYRCFQFRAFLLTGLSSEEGETEADPEIQIERDETQLKVRMLCPGWTRLVCIGGGTICIMDPVKKHPV